MRVEEGDERKKKISPSIHIFPPNENTKFQHLPTALVFMAGIIKFAEKIWSLQLASASTTLQSIIRDPYLQKFLSHVRDPEDTMVTGNDVEVLPDETVVRNAYAYFNIFKCLVVDAMLGQRERNIRQQFWFYQTAVDSLRIIEVELNLFYHAFYTKTSVICSKVGLSFRFLSVGSVVAALVLFTYHQKRGCNEFDVTVTYTLLYGAVALDIVSFLMLIFSDHSFTLWSESISGFSLISYACRLHHSKPREWIYKVLNIVGAKEVVEQWRYMNKRPLLQKLWIFVFEELQIKSLRVGGVKDIQRICSYRGEWVIREEAEDERQKEKENLKKRSDDEIETRNGVDDVRQKNNIGNDPYLEQGSDDGVVPEEDLRDVSERNKENISDVEKKYDDVELQHIKTAPPPPFFFFFLPILLPFLCIFFLLPRLPQHHTTAAVAPPPTTPHHRAAPNPSASITHPRRPSPSTSLTHLQRPPPPPPSLTRGSPTLPPPSPTGGDPTPPPPLPIRDSPPPPPPSPTCGDPAPPSSSPTCAAPPPPLSISQGEARASSLPCPSSPSLLLPPQAAVALLPHTSSSDLPAANTKTR
ncbi:hypothetical protein Fmac_026447 [Flemingia macrophylla]|uniref:DUF4220 domain-containing protein n=1 Tax=Flemingia macrophylla TaxID=520843 RepID=A0ABD1LFH0_9FABA